MKTLLQRGSCIYTRCSLSTWAIALSKAKACPFRFGGEQCKRQAGRLIRKAKIIPPCWRRFSMERRGNHKMRKWQFLYPQGEKSTHRDWTSRIDFSREGWDDGGDLVVQGETGPQAGHYDRSHRAKQDAL